MIEVCCAIIIEGYKILATRRSRGMHLAGFWEFPGGKIESGETAEECIIREIREELNIEISVEKQLKPVKHHYPEKSIRLIPFICKLKAGKITLTDHSEFRWLAKHEIFEVNWAAADLKVLQNFTDLNLKIV
jgi:8-oxo-dGTP diphosphatase